MYEPTTRPQIRDGIARAHRERAEALRNALRWISRRR